MYKIKYCHIYTYNNGFRFVIKYHPACRLYKAAHGLSGESLKTRAISEGMLLETYGVELPPIEPLTIPSGPVDTTSVKILKVLHPIVLEDHQPLAVYADGNCWFRAVSRLLYGHEDFHLLLRLKVAIEIAMNPSFYNTSARAYKDLIKDVRVVTPR